MTDPSREERERWARSIWNELPNDSGEMIVMLTAAADVIHRWQNGTATTRFTVRRLAEIIRGSGGSILGDERKSTDAERGGGL